MERGSSGHRVVLLAFDAGNPSLVRRWAADGHLPNFARVLARGATATVDHEPGLFVGSIWPTALTGVGVDRHGFYTGIRPAPFSYDYIPAVPEADPLWVDVAAAGGRIAVVDAPFFAAVPGLDGLQLVEWGCHDRYHGTHAEPPGLLDDVQRDVGRHPIGMIDHELGYERFAPCDWLHTTDGVRTHEDTKRFVTLLTDAIEHRMRMGKYVIDQGPFDLVVNVVAESHCAGHHLWALHDVDHPGHDADLRTRLGSDPLLDAYRRFDDLLGLHLDAMGGDGTLFVFLSHGMRPHFDGTHLLDEVLWRLDQAYRDIPRPWVGRRTEGAAAVLSRLPAPARRTAAAALGAAAARQMRSLPDGAAPRVPVPGPSERLWYQLENNTVTGAVRFNRAGREPSGALGASMVRHASGWLAEELGRLVNVDTGRRVIDEVYPTDVHYRRRDDDGLPDLLVEWAHDHPIERVWSPTTGFLARRYDGVRSGDHDGRGELIALGPGIGAGRCGAIRPVDIAPTVAAAAGVFLRDRDGAPVDGLLGGSRSRSDAVRAAHDALERDRSGEVRSRSVGDDAALRQEMIELRRRIHGLEAAHHETRQLAATARSDAGLAVDVLATGSWLRDVDVPEGLLVSVVMPTCGRLDLLRRAVGSVLGQTYPRLELVVVDDASADGTREWLAGLDDERVVVIRNGRRLGEGGSRNVGLDRARGDLITFLDDDNTFDLDWLRGVVWLFTERPETQVAYGARLVDDVERHHGRPGPGLPWLQLNEWDRATNAERCLVDVNTLAHRPGPVRFDPELVVMTDWDYLLGLTADADPARLPVLACRYTTSAPDRATDVHRPLEEEMYTRVRQRWSGGA